jgi:hypothetical protein
MTAPICGRAPRKVSAQVESQRKGSASRSVGSHQAPIGGCQLGHRAIVIVGDPDVDPRTLPSDFKTLAEWDENNKDEMDLYPDVYLGRLPCTNKIDVRTMVKKIINYEKDKSDESWFKKMVLITFRRGQPYGMPACRQPPQRSRFVMAFRRVSEFRCRWRAICPGTGCNSQETS